MLISLNNLGCVLSATFIKDVLSTSWIVSMNLMGIMQPEDGIERSVRLCLCYFVPS